jgi:hypothetical protein
MRHLRERNLYLIVFLELSYWQPTFIYIVKKVAENTFYNVVNLEKTSFIVTRL